MLTWPTIRRRVFLRIFRWRILLRHMALATFWVVVMALSVVSIPLWHYFGTDIALPILADATPILLAIVGVVMSYIQPKKENHRSTTFVLIIAGLLGSAILSANRIRSDAAHKKEMTELGKKVDTVRDQNSKLSNFLLEVKSTGTMSEADRRKGIETVLRNEYILSQNPIDPDILAGNKMPSQAWMNKRLTEMGEHWKVANIPTVTRPNIIQQVMPEPPMANVVFSFEQGDMTQGPVTTIEDPIKDGKASVSIIAMVTGSTPAENLHIWIRECISCDWQSPLPAGFSPSDQETPFDRKIDIPELQPNIRTQKWDFTIRLPLFPKTNSLPIFCYYACKNCPPVDWGKPQVLLVKQPHIFTLQRPAISYAPVSVPK